MTAGEANAAGLLQGSGRLVQSRSQPLLTAAGALSPAPAAHSCAGQQHRQLQAVEIHSCAFPLWIYNFL